MGASKDKAHRQERLSSDVAMMLRDLAEDARLTVAQWFEASPLMAELVFLHGQLMERKSAHAAELRKRFSPPKSGPGGASQPDASRTSRPRS
jgi:hypothetical protein